MFGAARTPTRAAPLRSTTPPSQRRAEVVDLPATGATCSGGCPRRPRSPCRSLTEPHLDDVSRRPRSGAARRTGSCDRPAAIVRLLEEVSAAGVEQVILVTSDVALHARTRSRARLVDPRARLADYLAGAEASAARDALTALFDRFSGVFQIQPMHNAARPVRSRRVPTTSVPTACQTLAELARSATRTPMRQFIEPVVGGERRRARAHVRPDRGCAAPTPSTPRLDRRDAGESGSVGILSWRHRPVALQPDSSLQTEALKPEDDMLSKPGHIDDHPARHRRRRPRASARSRRRSTRPPRSSSIRPTSVRAYQEGGSDSYLYSRYDNPPSLTRRGEARRRRRRRGGAGLLLGDGRDRPRRC